MNTEISAFAPAAGNPFAAFLSPEVVIAAHQRMASGTVHRPLDKPRLVRAGWDAVAAEDADLDADDFDDLDDGLEADDDISDIVSSTSFTPLF